MEFQQVLKAASRRLQKLELSLQVVPPGLLLAVELDRGRRVGEAGHLVEVEDHGRGLCAVEARFVELDDWLSIWLVLLLCFGKFRINFAQT